MEQITTLGEFMIQKHEDALAPAFTTAQLKHYIAYAKSLKSKENFLVYDYVIHWLPALHQVELICLIFKKKMAVEAELLIKAIIPHLDIHKTGPTPENAANECPRQGAYSSSEEVVEEVKCIRAIIDVKTQLKKTNTQ
ncbi:MCM DNA helicase complex subunit mcm6 [Asimina triloba]